MKIDDLHYLYQLGYCPPPRCYSHYASADTTSDPPYVRLVEFRNLYVELGPLYLIQGDTLFSFYKPVETFSDSQMFPSIACA